MRNLASQRAENPFARTLRGVELWRGPSPYNGDPIVMVGTFHSDNTKTGDMIQTWIIRTDEKPTEAYRLGHEDAICGSCPLKATAAGGSGLCYVNKIGVNQIYDAWKRGLYPRFNRPKHLKLFAGRTIRWGAYGDPAMVPIEVVRPIMAVARGWSGYTHAWRLDFAQDWKPFLMASTESINSHHAAKALGWRSFRIRMAGEALLARERICPASEEGGFKVQCENCLACDGSRTTGLADLSIVVHGKAGVAQRFTRLSVAGVLV